MIAPTFLQVTSATGCTLADLSVTGYDAPKYDPEMEMTDGGCLGDFILQFLNQNGTTKARYVWIDDDNGHKGWYANSDGDEIEGGASSVAISAGESLWTIGGNLKLVTSGKVLTSDILFQTTKSGAVAVGNGTPINLTLNQLVVTGYDTPKYDPEMEITDGGCLGDFIVQFLNTNGTTKNRYVWIDDDNGHLGWYANSDGDEIEGGASSVSIPSGDGMWIIGGGLNITIPAPEL